MAQLAVTGDHKKGWTLRSGGFANLCDKCGTAYEQVAFCELYHLDDTGWRECTSCGKRLHCGCIASSAFLELLDNGGVNCVSCSNPKTRETRSSSVDNHVNLGNFNEKILTKLDDEAIDNGKKLLLPSVNNDVSRCRMTQEENGTSESVHAGRFKDVCGSVVQTNLNKTYSYFHQGHWPRYIFPKSILSQRFNGNGGMMSSQLRVARPPVEGYVKNQLLPRYWPRITEQELQQISGDSNATIVPLFEKVLSASDVGRIGRLVLPKACAEAYFPAISQPEGLPLKIKDVKGTEWLFQFRFWPNNNSRMYVLEGVTPCIQSMQLQAGDTVTFSRMEPEGKLLMGFRKASTSTSVQLQKGNTYSHLNELSRNLILANGNVGWHTNEQFGMGGSFPEKKRSRNIGSKSKRLLIESQDALELKHTWEESQDMLFPAPLLKPTIVTIDNNELEEYEEPPVFGKGSIFTVCSSGFSEQEQWGQCDNCSKWRKLPADFILPPRWTCQENVWDQSRAVCLAPNELSLRELDNLLRLAKDFENMKHCVSHKTEEDDMGIESSSVAMTTKHPRHRPGCSCIVCIQPPSGKGKHKSTCSCNVCMTVKRRFKTLMLRKKKRQLEEHESRIGKEKGDLELNRVSMMSLVQVANLPLETYLKQNGLTSLISSSGETGETLGGDEEDDCRELQGPDGNIQEACL